MRLFVLYQGETLESQPGYHDGFQRLKAEGVLSDYQAIPYSGFARIHGWPALWNEAERLVRAAGSDTVFLQFFEPQGHIPDLAMGIARLRACPACLTIFTSTGDGYTMWLKPIPDSFRIASRLADLNFMTQIGRPAQELARLGTKNIVLMPNGACQKRFSAPLDQNTYLPEFDVVFVGNSKRSRMGFSSSSLIGFWRDRLVNKLSKRFGRRFGLFGKRWEGNRSWQGPVPYNQQHEAMRRSRVLIGGHPGILNDYYTSDRTFIALASGIPLVDYWVPGIECFFGNGAEWWLGRTFDQMIAQVETLLEKPQKELLQIGNAVRREVLEHHTQYHRCKLMVEIACRYRETKLAGKQPEPPDLPFLRFPLASGSIAGLPIINWQG